MSKQENFDKNKNNEFLKKAAEKMPLILNELEKLYPEAICSLNYENPFQLLVSTQLSAQCTDARVNLVTPALFERFPDAKAFSEAEIDEIEKLIYSTGFYKNKARNLKGCASAILENFNGEVPDTMEALLSLPGVGRKTANLVLGDAFHKPSYVIDTHAKRLCNRMGLTQNDDPVKIEMDLRTILPPNESKPNESSDLCHRFVLHGRACCTASRPKCHACPIGEKGLCNYYNGLL